VRSAERRTQGKRRGPKKKEVVSRKKRQAAAGKAPKSSSKPLYPGAVEKQKRDVRKPVMKEAYCEKKKTSDTTAPRGKNPAARDQ